MKYYDVTFHGVSGRSVVKRTVPSERDPYEAWQDACALVTDDEIRLLVNEIYVTMRRELISRIDVEAVTDPIDEAETRKDELRNVINTLSNMGL